MTTPTWTATDDDTASVPSAASNPDELWHLAADWEEEARSDAGLPWRTLCGQVRPYLRAVGNDWWAGAEPDDCVVCFALFEQVAS